MLASDTALLQYDQVLNLQYPERETVNMIQVYIDENESIVDASSDFLARKIHQGDYGPRREPCAESYMDLITLDKDVDSWLARTLKRMSFLQFLSMVRGPAWKLQDLVSAVSD